MYDFFSIRTYFAFFFAISSSSESVMVMRLFQSLSG